MSPQSSDQLFDSGDFDPAGGFGGTLDPSADPNQMLETIEGPRARAPVQKQPFGVFNVMLILSLIAMTAAAILFYIEVGRFSQP